jgi:hypothetical protein
MVSFLGMGSWRDAPGWPWIDLVTFRDEAEAVCRHVYERGEPVYVEIGSSEKSRDGVIVGRYLDTEVTIVLDEYAVRDTGFPRERPVELR